MMPTRGFVARKQATPTACCRAIGSVSSVGTRQISACMWRLMSRTLERVGGRIIAASIAGPISYDASGRIPADAGSGSGDATISDSSPLPIVLTANTSHDFSARRVGQTSRVLHEADISTVFGADNYLRYMNWALYMDGSVIAATIQKISGRAAGADGPFSLFTSGAAVSGKIVFLQTAISHASHTWNLRVHSKDASIGGGFGLHVGVKLSSFDLGIE